MDWDSFHKIINIQVLPKTQVINDGMRFDFSNFHKILFYFYVHKFNIPTHE